MLPLESFPPALLEYGNEIILGHVVLRGLHVDDFVFSPRVESRLDGEVANVSLVVDVSCKRKLKNSTI